MAPYPEVGGMGSLSGKAAIVTGGARGLGLTYALRLADRGANVAVADIDLSSFEEYDREAKRLTEDSVVAELESRGVDALGIETDVTDPEGVESMVREVDETFSSVDVLIANAGGGVSPIHETHASTLEPDHLKATMARNLYGTVYCCTAVAERMKRQRSGTIITVGSQAGRMPREDGSYAHYGAAKAGIIMYTKYLAQDLGEYGITANAIAPGAIGTGRLLSSYEEAESDELDRLADAAALGRIGDPEDCADVVEFLASDQSDFVTGTVVPIDGGSTRLG